MADVIVGNSTADIKDRWISHTIQQPENPADDGQMLFADGGVFLLTDAGTPNVGDLMTFGVGGVPLWAPAGTGSVSVLQLTDRPADYVGGGGLPVNWAPG